MKKHCSPFFALSFDECLGAWRRWRPFNGWSVDVNVEFISSFLFFLAGDLRRWVDVFFFSKKNIPSSMLPGSWRGRGCFLEWAVVRGLMDLVGNGLPPF